MKHSRVAIACGSDFVSCISAWRMLQALCLLAFLFMLAPSAWSATYYVATNGNDASSGLSLSSPFKTVQKAMNVVNPGDTVYVRGGTYREEVTANRGGSAGNYVNLFAYNNEVPVIKGSELVSGWVRHSGNIWKKTGWTTNSQQVFAGYTDGPSLQQIGMPSRYYDSFKYPSPVGSGVSSMVPGSFYYEAGSSTLYIWLADGSNPNTQPIEVSTHRRLFFMARPYIHIKGFAFRHSSASTYSEQGSAVELSSYSIIENSDIQYTDFAGLSMGYLQTGALAVGCNVSNNGDSGINAAASYAFRIANSTMNNNNTRNFNPLWHAGGFKGASKTYGTLEFNEIGFNKGSGIWFDFANSSGQIVVRNNYIHDNGPKEAAIFMEVSKNAMIYNNVIVNNERRGIYLSASDNMRVYNNTVTGTRTYAAIELGGMPRSGATLTGNAIYNNIISNNSTKYDMVFAVANGSTIRGNTSNNNDIYRAAGAIQVAYGSMYNTLASWRTATKMDMNSISANPAFVPMKTPAAAESYMLQSSSPAIDSGMALAAVPYDYATNPHKSGQAYDMGAFERVSTAPADTTAPLVTISNPAQNGMSFPDGMVKINASASDNVAVTSLILYVDGKQVANSSGQPIAYTWDMRNLSAGAHAVYVEAADAQKNLGKLTRSVIYNKTTAPASTPTPASAPTPTPAPVSSHAPAPTPRATSAKDVTAPVVTISSPSADYMSFKSGIVNINVSCSDNVACTGLSLYVNGRLAARTAGKPISYSWNMKGLRLGTHMIHVSATDDRRNLGKLFRPVRNY